MSDCQSEFDGDAVLGGVGAVVFESSLDGMLVVDCATGRILKANAAAERLLGYAGGELEGKSYTVLFPEDSSRPGADVTDDIQFHDQVLKQSFRRADGVSLVLDLTAVMLNVSGCDWILVTLRDSTERDAQARRMADAARVDALTGLYSRAELERKLALEHHRGLRYGTPYSVCFVDVDHYKLVNDRYGHIVGDEVLKSFARILNAELRATDFAGRYGGDEIVIVLPHTEPSTAYNVIERIRKRVDAAPLRAGRSVVEVTASFGIASSVPGQGSIEQVLELADAALYDAKSQGRNRTCIHGHADLEQVARSGFAGCGQ